jgi:hypothetical protein
MSSGDSTELKSTQPTPLDPVATRERVPGHPDYYEKDGLRTYGDDEDHDHEPPVSIQNIGLRYEANHIIDDLF